MTIRKIVSRSIGTDVIAAEDLAANSVTVAEISDGAVTSAKLDTNIDVAGTLDVTGATTLDAGLTVDTDTLVVDETNNRVGIGTSSPDDTLEVFYSSGNSAVSDRIANFDGNGSAGDDVARYIGVLGNASFGAKYRGGEGWGAWVNGSTAIYFSNGTVGSETERMRIDSSGNLDLRIGGGNIIMASGAGINFNATADGDGTTSSELFDDYEEGSWTPALKFGGGSTSMTFSSGYPIGRYTKIGNTVYVYFDIRLTNKGSSTGDMIVDDLPFTALNINVRQGGNLTFFANSGSNWNSNQYVTVQSGSNNIELRYGTPGGNTVFHTHADVNNAGQYQGFVIYNVS